MTRREALMLVCAGALLRPGAASAQAQAPGGSFAPGGADRDRYFRFDWTKAGSKLTGYAYSSANRYAARVQLLIEGLDGSGKVTSKTTTWVLDGIPPNGRAFFEAAVPKASAYRVRVLSFEWSEPRR